MNHPLISVIIPVYRPGSLLKKTLESIKNQTFRDFECLLIDDGGKDQTTTRICRKFTDEDRRFKLFEKENEGIEKTRLYGVEVSSAGLIAFGDHDDYYEPQAFEILYRNWQQSNADVVVANCYSQRFHSIKWRTLNNVIKENVVLDQRDFYSNYYCNFFGINIFPVSTWGKLYDKKLFNEQLKSFGYNFFEDTVINAQLFFRASKVHFVTDKVFTHIYGGLSSRFNVNTVIDAYDDIYEFRNELLKKAGVFEKFGKYLLIEYKNVINQNILLMIENNYNSEQFLEVIEIIKTKKLYHDIVNSPQINRGDFIPLMVADNNKELYHIAKQSYTSTMRIKKQLKNFIHWIQ